MNCELSKAKGTYVVLARLAEARRLAIGRLGTFDLIPGYYAYVGSAHGSGGLRARLEHHVGSTAKPFWHIDYLLQWAQPVELWLAASSRKLEQDWAELLAGCRTFRQPIPRFGASDCQPNRASHLFYARRRPSFRWFRQKIRVEFEPGLEVRQAVLEAVANDPH